MKTESTKQLAKAYGLTQSHFTLLHLGFFFEDLGRRVNVTRLAREVNVKTPDNRIYKLQPGIMIDFLQQMYDRPTDSTPLSHLIFVSSLRTIAMSLITAFDSTMVGGVSEIVTAYETDIFAGDAAITDSFVGITRFLRNVLSHNIEDRLNLQEADYLAQLNFRNSKANKFDPVMRFEYDYSKVTSAIHIPEYAPDLRIELNLNNVRTGQMLDEALPTYEALLFGEFCYNSLFFLNQKYVATSAS